MMKSAFPPLLVLCLGFGGLSACGSDQKEISTFSALQSYGTGLAGKFRKTAVPAGASQGITRATVDGIGAPVDLVTIENRGAQGLIVQVGTNGSVETWSSADNKTLSMRNGMLVATRGLGGDLMSAAVPNLAQLESGQTVKRAHTVLDGEDKPFTHRFDCRGIRNGAKTITVVERSYQTQHITEDCNGPDGSFSNDYWVQTGGKLRRSRQFVSESVGFVVIEHLQ